MFFDGDNDFVGDMDALGITAYPFTFECWANVTTFNNQAMISIQDNAEVDIRYTIGCSTGSKLRIIAQNTTFSNIETINTFDAGTWIHVVGVFATDTSKIIYVNGNQERILTTSVSFAGSVNSSDVGRFGDFTPAGFFDGLIDEVRIYNRALTADEIKQNYELGRVI